ncbi:phytanoyl-CoA dioxygenase family protein [Nocardiopsis mangrovi]|uniref:Phytanoyl-CoA dioxygenase family protein n=1 Tax=Nocardiopsis mangrovi TaxID=1179818 RepID=A0ABV9DWQ0_9ACTN
MVRIVRRGAADLDLYTRLGVAGFGPWAGAGELGRLLAAIGLRRPGPAADPHRELPGIAAVAADPVVAGAARGVLGADLDIEASRLIVVPPGGADSPPRRNRRADLVEFDPRRTVTLWLALTPATARTWCPHIAPGSHRGSGPAPGGAAARGPARPTAVLDPAAPARWEPVPMAAGHGLLIDPRLVRRVPPNRGRAPAVALAIRYTAPGGCTMRDGTAPAHLVPVPSPYQ